MEEEARLEKYALSALYATLRTPLESTFFFVADQVHCYKANYTTQRTLQIFRDDFPIIHIFNFIGR
jgi:hypothetical protein